METKQERNKESNHILGSCVQNEGSEAHKRVQSHENNYFVEVLDVLLLRC